MPAPAAEIILQVQKASDLFKTPPVRFNGLQVLDRDVETYLMERAAQFHRKDEFLINIHISGDVPENESEIADRIHHHFRHCLTMSKKQLSHTLKLGWRSLGIAFVFLLLMYTIANRLVPQLPQGGLTITIKEVFIILGWVALWRPAELLLYEWFPIRKKVRLLERLSTAKFTLSA